MKKHLILTLFLALIFMSCQTTQHEGSIEECQAPDPYSLVAAANSPDQSIDVYIGVGVMTPENEELLRDYGVLMIEPVSFIDGIRALIAVGMLCTILDHNFGHDGFCMICGEQMELESL